MCERFWTLPLAHLSEGDLLRPLGHLDQSTSAARFIAGLFGFFSSSFGILSFHTG